MLASALLAAVLGHLAIVASEDSGLTGAAVASTAAGDPVLAARAGAGVAVAQGPSADAWRDEALDHLARAVPPDRAVRHLVAETPAAEALQLGLADRRGN